MLKRKPIVDPFHRKHTNLRLSVTDRCNIRCFYCMPAENVEFQSREELLTFEEICRFVRVAATMGVDKIRLTGGEPLVRSHLSLLVKMLVDVEGIRDVALTTNGLLLADQAAELYEAGLHRLNISLDTLDEATFQRISRRPGLHRVLDGIAAARQVGFENIRLNALAIRNLTEHEAASLVQFAIEQELDLRFIEFMPLDADAEWESGQVLSGAAVLSIIESEFGPTTPAVRDDPAQPAVNYQFTNPAFSQTQIGFINPVSEPFCGDCNRLRLTADGQIRNCLFSTEEWDARAILRRDHACDRVADDHRLDDHDLASLIYACVAQKKPGHGIDSPEFLKPRRAMYQIGG